MHGKARTKAQQRRIEILKSEIGCLACRMDGRGYVPADYHHATQRPQGVAYHDWGYPLCKWHHVAEGQGDGTPSRHRHKRRFQEAYGSEEDLVGAADMFVDQFNQSVVGL